MSVIKEDGFIVRIPEIPTRYRPNCSGDWGLFVTGNTAEKRVLDAQKEGLTKGDYVDLALCWTAQKNLTFNVNYTNEKFTEIWGVPVAGEMSEKFPNKNISELSTFLMHRQSQDEFAKIIEEFDFQAFNQWLDEGMPEGEAEYMEKKRSAAFFENIVCFKLIPVKAKYKYHYVQASLRKPKTDNEKKALKIAKQIYEGQLNGLEWCTDPAIEENAKKTYETAQAQKQGNSEQRLLNSK